MPLTTPAGSGPSVGCPLGLWRHRAMDTGIVWQEGRERASCGAPASPHGKRARVLRRALDLGLHLAPTLFTTVGVTAPGATPDLSARVSVLRAQGAEFGAAHSHPAAGGAAPPTTGWTSTPSPRVGHPRKVEQTPRAGHPRKVQQQAARAPLSRDPEHRESSTALQAALDCTVPPCRFPA